MITFNEGYNPQGSQEGIEIIEKSIVQIIKAISLAETEAGAESDLREFEKALELLRSIDILEKALVFFLERNVAELEKLHEDPKKVDAIKESISFFQEKNKETLDNIRDIKEKLKK
ncbi:MAG: hypothetical protein UR90_C0033G0008 [Parcubacteria group bacterium GW2011_GWC1_35_8]|nr:MAG: hypothetical protein UR90_C0033G0008 [Parcubacteria group bacterium GW2011_GWC1_35_8]